MDPQITYTYASDLSTNNTGAWTYASTGGGGSPVGMSPAQTQPRESIKKTEFLNFQRNGNLINIGRVFNFKQ